MANVAGKLSMKVLTLLIGIPVGIVSKKAIARAWVAIRPEDPPHDVRDGRVRWGDAIGYAALAGAGSVAAQLVTRRGAEKTYRALLGVEPPPAPPTKAQKRLAEASEAAAD